MSQSAASRFSVINQMTPVHVWVTPHWACVRQRSGGGAREHDRTTTRERAASRAEREQTSAVTATVRVVVGAVLESWSFRESLSPATARRASRGDVTLVLVQCRIPYLIQVNFLF